MRVRRSRAQYIMRYPKTYITRFFGMHRVKMHHLHKKIHFVIMQSVFYGDNEIHEMYDLKGSTVGRKVSDEDRLMPKQCVFKDLDMISCGQKIKLGPNRAAFVDQIRKDAELLASLKIMDYSLLLGIHHRSRKHEKGECRMGMGDSCVCARALPVRIARSLRVARSPTSVGSGFGAPDFPNAPA